MEEKIVGIDEVLGREDLLLMLAEECAELSQACLKMVRSDKGTAYKPRIVCEENLAEEIADVKIVIEGIEQIMPNIKKREGYYREYKEKRRMQRIKGVE